MIYDCFSFFNELDLLEIRLNTLDKVVDKFILAESTLTHTGNPKPLYYAENKNRFAKFNDRIIHIIVDDFPTIPDAKPQEMAWIRENWQRNAIMRGLPVDAKDDDYVILSDLDEIPSPNAIIKAVQSTTVSRLYLTMFYYFLNYKNYTYPTWQLGPQVLPLKLLLTDELLSEYNPSAFVDPRVNKGMTPTVARFLNAHCIIKNAGWHFSYCGGIPAIQAKLKSIAHTENDIPENTNYNQIKKRIFAGKPPFERDDRFFAVRINSTFPPCIQENKEKYSALIFQITPAYIAKTFFSRLYTAAKTLLTETLRMILPRAIRNWLYFHFVEK